MFVSRFTIIAAVDAALTLAPAPASLAARGATSSGSAGGNKANGVADASGTRAIGTGNAQRAGDAAGTGVKGTGSIGDAGAAPDSN